MSGEGTEALVYRWARRGIIAIGVLAVLGGIALAVLIGFTVWDTPRFEPAKVDTADRRHRFTIGDVRAIDQTRLVSINVSEGEANGDPYSYSYSRNDLRNVLILDTGNGKSWLLLPTNERRIVDLTWLPAAATGPADDDMIDVGDIAGIARSDVKRPVSPTVYFLFKLDRPDKHYDLVAGTIDGRSRGTVMQGIDGLDSSWMSDGDHLALIVREGGRLFYRSVDLRTYKTALSRPIAVAQ